MDVTSTNRFWTAMACVALCTPVVASTPTAADLIPPDITGIESVTSSRVGRADVQGIRLGMKMTEAATALQKKGYRNNGTGGGMTTFVLGADSDYRELRIQESLVDGANIVAYIDYVQHFKNSFDKEAIRKQVVEKYGEPSKQEPFGTALLLKYYDSTESLNDLQSKTSQQCYKEIVASRKAPAYQATGLVQSSAQPALWVSRGDGAVRENCPNTLPIYYQSIKSYYAPQMTVGIGRDVSRGVASQSAASLSIQLYSQALKEHGVIVATRKEKDRLKAAPAAKADL